MRQALARLAVWERAGPRAMPRDVLLSAALLIVSGCVGVQQSVPPAPTAPGPAAVASPAAPAPSPASAAAPSPSAATSPVAAPTPAPRPTAAATAAVLPTVERARPQGSTGFLTPVELELEFAEPVTSSDELNKVVDGLLQLNGVAAVHADAVRVSLRYDTTAVLPARIRDRLRELGHPAQAGTEVQNPGDAAD